VPAADLWAQQLNSLRAPEDISTHEVAVEHRYIQTDGGGRVRYSHDLTPHLKEVHDACDDPSKRVVAVKGPARSGKTIAWENFLLKVGMFGPSRNVLWYMHSEPDVKRYVKERVDWFLREHEGFDGKRAAKVESWNLREIEGRVWEWLAANPSTTRARSASVAVADEIDAMRPVIRDAIVTLLKNRQKEYGNTAKILVSSHPDAGPLFGIDSIIADSDHRYRLGPCPHCAKLIGAAREVPAQRRGVWNIAQLMKLGEGMEREAMLDMVAHEVRIICPHCRKPITNQQRLDLRHDAMWFGRGQEVDRYDRKITGKLIAHEVAGFIFHAFDAPFDSLATLARPFVAALLKATENGDKTDLKEQTVKSLGETFVEDEAASKPRVFTEIKTRLIDSGYAMGTVPRGVDFLTMMVDVQGDRFEPGVIGWSRNAESWLIDRFAAKQTVGWVDIKPGLRLKDWDVLNDMLSQTYPLADGSGRRLGIAKMGVDTGGVPGVTDNARRWVANHVAAGTFQPWQVSLQMGDAWKKNEFVGPYRQITHVGGRELPVPIGERTINVFELKKILADRMQIEAPGPLRMHLPGDVTDSQIRELISETLINGQWIRKGKNELWDIWVGCEVVRRLLDPEDNRIDWSNPPPWARPFMPVQDKAEAAKQKAEAGFYERFRQFNRRPAR